jgi:Mitochondrial export protein Som1
VLHYTWLERLTGDKLFSLFAPFISYKEKEVWIQFYAPRFNHSYIRNNLNFWKLFLVIVKAAQTLLGQASIDHLKYQPYLSTHHHKKLNKQKCSKVLLYNNAMFSLITLNCPYSPMAAWPSVICLNINRLFFKCIPKNQRKKSAKIIICKQQAEVFKKIFLFLFDKKRFFSVKSVRRRV